jgi:sporulation protein YlmC with PRC-barrel domain
MAVKNKAKTHFIPTSHLKLYNVVNTRGEDLGQVQNFIVDMVSARIAYVLVAFEGFLGLTDKWIPMPFEVLTWIPEKNRFETDIARKVLEKAPTISKSEWPDKFLDKLELAEHSAWLENIYIYYGRTPYWVEFDGERCGVEASGPVMMETVTTYVNTDIRDRGNIIGVQPAAATVKTHSVGDVKMKEMKTPAPKKMETHFIPTSRLKTYDVIDDTGEAVGQVERIIVDMHSGQIAYMLVGLKGHLNDRWVAVPPPAMTWQPARNDFKLDVSRKILLEAPTIPKADWPDKFLADLEKEDHARWLEEVYEYYNFTPFWIIVETEA